MAEDKVKFIPEYADLIASAANNWAWVELEVHWMIWGLLGVNPVVGACVTSQMYTFNAKMDGLVALMKVREVAPAIIKQANAFAEASRSALEARNRFVHDVWLTDNHDPSMMGRTTMSARRKLDFKTVSVPLSALKSDLVTIQRVREMASEIRKALAGALPTLPQIPREALHPLSGIR